MPAHAGVDSIDRIADLDAHLAAHVPADDVEARHLRRVRDALATMDEPFDQAAGPVHVTGSAIVLPSDGSVRTVLHLHKRLRRWLQPGGHVDAGETAQDGALRESVEETGLDVHHPDGEPRLVHVHVHDGGRGHTHLDTRWLLLADPDQPFAPGEGESHHVGWFAPDDLHDRTDDTVTAAFTAACHLLGRDPTP